MTNIFLPSFDKLTPGLLRRDFMAALVVTAIAIPESLGYAVIVGLPVQSGLYCALMAPLLFALFTTSRHLVIGADSATAALVAVGAAAIVQASGGQYADAVAVLGLVTATTLLILAIARLGFLADLLSRPVLIGFVSGVGVQLVIGKLPEMLGLHASGALLHKLAFLVTHLGSLEIMAAAVSLLVVCIVVLGWQFKLPGALLALLAAIGLTRLLHLQHHGLAVIGGVPSGLPVLHVPSISMAAVEAAVPFAITIALVILAQSLAVSRSSASKYEEQTNDNQDLAALGAANAASALFGGFAVNGSPPRTTAGEMAGGRSQLVNVFMALMIGVALLFATDLFEYVPTAALAAIIFTIGLHLIQFNELRDILRVRPSEFTVALSALVAVALLGVQQGVMIAVLISLADRLRRQYHPQDDVLVRDGKAAAWATDRIADTSKHGGTPTVPDGLLVYRFSESIFFENAAYFLRRAMAAVTASDHPINSFVLDAGAISDVDYTGAEALKKLFRQLAANEITLEIAHVSPKLKGLLETYGIADLIGQEAIFPSVRKAVESYAQEHITSLDKIQSLGLNVKDYVVIGGASMELRGIRRTKNVDLVVSEKLYSKLRTSWKEYVHDDGKRILVKHGYRVMTKWIDFDLTLLQRSAESIQGVPVMSLEDLIACKTAMGRHKDLVDLKLLKRAG